VTGGIWEGGLASCCDESSRPTLVGWRDMEG
jgi:hypothetical protein